MDRQPRCANGQISSTKNDKMKIKEGEIVIIPELKFTHVMSEEWIDSDDFYICLDAFVGEVNCEGTEVFRFHIVSPKRLLRVLEGSNEIEIGRGYLITTDYSHSKIEARLSTLLRNCGRTTWDDVIQAICRYGYWESET
ncbi:Imm8 family immunity protein [Paenibacillus sp. GCM10027629]|uniref:Imm8 family immunity protein n=1 Tax=Paenibacillus sp. GCM10027629 TaxID=3273414 RepID=UPI00362A95E8